jgi:hypothetical protein
MAALAALLALAAAARPARAAAAAWRLCDAGGGRPAVNITGVAVAPDPLQPGAPATFTLAGASGVAVEGGELRATVRYLNVKVYTRAGTLCEGPAAGCPPVPGPCVFSFDVNMPRILPPGAMVLELSAERADTLPLFCVRIDLRRALEEAAAA